MTARKMLLTAEDLEALPDSGHGYELVRGELRPMSPTNPRHGEVVIQIGFVLQSWVWQTRAGRVVGGEPGVIIERDPDTVRAPDVAFITRARKRPAGPGHGFLDTTPDLVVEVASPGDTPREIAAKTQVWLVAGAQLVWNVYPDRETVEAFWADGRRQTYTAADTLAAEPLLPGFAVPVAELFALPDEDE